MLPGITCLMRTIPREVYAQFCLSPCLTLLAVSNRKSYLSKCSYMPLQVGGVYRGNSQTCLLCQVSAFHCRKQLQGEGTVLPFTSDKCLSLQEATAGRGHGAAFRAYDNDLQGPALLGPDSQGERQGQSARTHGGSHPMAGAAAGHQRCFPTQSADLPDGCNRSWQDNTHGCASRQKDR